MMNLKTIPLFASLLVLTGCIPSIQKKWDVQPVEGTVVDAETGQPVQDVTITNQDDPTLTTRTNDNGQFGIEEQTHIGFHMLMVGSAMDTQTWRISHPDYPDAVAQTQSLIPPLSRELQTLTIPLFRQLPASPQICPDFGYLLKLGQWRADKQIEMRFVEPASCEDPEALDTLYEVWFPEFGSE